MRGGRLNTTVDFGNLSLSSSSSSALNVFVVESRKSGMGKLQEVVLLQLHEGQRSCCCRATPPNCPDTTPPLPHKLLCFLGGGFFAAVGRVEEVNWRFPSRDGGG